MLKASKKVFPQYSDLFLSTGDRGYVHSYLLHMLCTACPQRERERAVETLNLLLWPHSTNIPAVLSL